MTRIVRHGGILLATAMLSIPACDSGTVATDQEGSPAPDPAAPQLPDRVGAFTWNVCGAAVNPCEGTGTSEKELDLVMHRVKSDPAVVAFALQETCRKGHAQTLKGLLGGNWEVKFFAAHKMGGQHGEPVSCSLPDVDGQHAGTLVAMKKLSGRALDAADEPFVGVPGGDDVDGHPTQGAACLRDPGVKLMACTAHFPNEGADAEHGSLFDARAKSAQQYSAIGNQWRLQGWRTILMGDFNVDGKRDRRYLGDFNDQWSYREADPGNDHTWQGATHGAKLDYLFFGGDWRLSNGGVDYNDRYVDLSDHYPLWVSLNPLITTG